MTPWRGKKSQTVGPNDHKNHEITSNQQIANLEDQVRQLRHQVQALEQGQDFRSHLRDAGTPHHEIQQRLATMQREIQGWIRMALKGWKSPDGMFPAADYPETSFLDFWSALRRIRHDNVAPDHLQQIPFSDLLAAIASSIIVEQAVMNPLGSCTRTFEGAVNSDVYKVMSKGEITLGGYLPP
jgi:hypothetical protein